MPIGLEEFHEGVVDIVSRRALRFEGAKGLEMVEGPVPAEMQEEVETRRAELIERVSEVSNIQVDSHMGIVLMDVQLFGCSALRLAHCS